MNEPLLSVSQARTAPAWPNSCSEKDMKYTVSSGGPHSLNTDRIDHLYHDPHMAGLPLSLHYGDLTDSSPIRGILEDVRGEPFVTRNVTPAGRH